MQHIKELTFDLITVFDTDILEAIAKQTGWTDDDKRIEDWIIYMANKDIKIKMILESNNNNTYIKGVKEDTTNFNIPLIMCRDEFLSKIMKLCGYTEDRYNKENTIKYIIDCQRINKTDEYTKLYLTIPIYDNIEED